MPRPTYLPTELYDSLLETDSRNRADRDIQGLGWQSKLDDALDGLQQTYEREWKPAPVILSERPDAMQIRAQQQRQPAAVRPTTTPETPSLSTFSTDDFVHENGTSTYRPAAAPSDASAIPGPELSPNGTPISVLRGAPAAATTTQAMPTGGQIDNSSRESFVRTAYPYMLQAAGGDANLAELMLAKAISENGSIGTGRPFFANNFSGIKGEGDAGSVEADTWEDYGNGPVNIRDRFAAYSTPQAGMAAFMQFLRDNSRYHPALQRYQQTGDADQLFRDILGAGYATDKAWADKVQNIRRNQVAPVVRQGAGDPRQSMNAVPDAPNPSGTAAPPPAGPGGEAPPGPALPPSVAARWQRVIGQPMTSEDLEQLRGLGLA